VHYSVDFVIVIFSEMMQTECSSDVAVEYIYVRNSSTLPIARCLDLCHVTKSRNMPILYT